jgi:hypothetical protein
MDIWTGLIWLRIGASGSSFEHGNEYSCSVKCREILEELSDWELFKKSSASWS